MLQLFLKSIKSGTQVVPQQLSSFVVRPMAKNSAVYRTKVLIYFSCNVQQTSQDFAITGTWRREKLGLLIVVGLIRDKI